MEQTETDEVKSEVMKVISIRSSLKTTWMTYFNKKGKNEKKKETSCVYILYTCELCDQSDVDFSVVYLETNSSRRRIE